MTVKELECLSLATALHKSYGSLQEDTALLRTCIGKILYSFIHDPNLNLSGLNSLCIFIIIYLHILAISFKGSLVSLI